jgi:hypothetical protein
MVDTRVDDMRAAYDRGRDDQLKQVMEWLDENITHYTDADYLGDCEHINDLESHLKEAMRPTQEDESCQDGNYLIGKYA